MKKFIFMAAVAFVLCTGLAYADTGVPQVPETQGFVTSTAMSAIGTVTESDSIVCQITNNALLGIPPALPLGIFDDTVYSSSYAETTIADQGLVTYTKGMTTDTAGMATPGLYNVRSDKIVDFIGSETGRMISDETSIIDGAGKPVGDENILICPFASGLETLNPAFCNIVEEGSSVDLTLGSLTTGIAQRFIMESGGHPAQAPYVEDPVSDPGIESDYSFKLTGFGQVPAMGSAETFIDVHVQEGRIHTFIINPNEAPATILDPKAEDLLYSETTTASGEITLFQKSMNYLSQITAPGYAEEIIGPID